MIRYFALALICIAVLSTKGMSSEIAIIAHRGDSKAFPENTMVAIQSALTVKADLIEFDVREVKGGGLYLFHDADLKRFKLGDRNVAELSAKEAESVDVGSWHDPKFASERAPTLKDAIEACLDGKTTPLIERKTGPADAYISVIRELNAEKDVIVQSFDWQFLTEIREKAPEIRIGALSGDELDEARWQRLQKLKPEWVGWKAKILNDKLIQRFQKAGFQVAVWTVNDDKEIQKFFRWKIDAVITDRPAQARKLRDSP